MLTVPIWLIFVISIATTVIGIITGVILCYSKTPRIGDIITTRDPETDELYLFLELSKPLSQTVGDIKDGKEVLATFRVKNTE